MKTVDKWKQIFNGLGDQNLTKVAKEILFTASHEKQYAIERKSRKAVKIDGISKVSTIELADRLSMPQSTVHDVVESLLSLGIIKSIESKYKFYGHRGKVFQIPEITTLSSALRAANVIDLSHRADVLSLTPLRVKGEGSPTPPPTKSNHLGEAVLLDSANATSVERSHEGLSNLPIPSAALRDQSPSSSEESEDSLSAYGKQNSFLNNEEEINQVPVLTKEVLGNSSRTTEERAEEEFKLTMPFQQEMAIKSPYEIAKEEEEERRKKESVEIHQWCDALFMLQKCYYIVSTKRPELNFYPMKMSPQTKGILKNYAMNFGKDNNGVVNFRRGIEIIRIMMHYAALKYEESNNNTFWFPTLESWLTNKHMAQLHGLDYDPAKTLSSPIPNSAWEFNKQCRDHLNEAMEYRKSEDDAMELNKIQNKIENGVDEV